MPQDLPAPVQPPLAPIFNWQDEAYDRDATREHIRTTAEEQGWEPGSEEYEAYARQYFRENVPYADLQDVVDHIDHVVRLVGVEHVGLGSDFDGVGDSLPTGLKDVSAYPNLVAALLQKGYSEDDVRLILGENALRVWAEVEQIAQEM